MNTQLKLEPKDALRTEFRELLNQYSHSLQDAETQVLAFHSPDLPFFSRLSHEQQLKAIHDVRQVLDVFNEMVSEGLSLKDSPKLLWRSLGRLGLTPCSDIFDRIKDGDVVCIYATDHRQIFQNLRFLELVNLTLEEIYCYEWYQYSTRADWAQKGLFEAGDLALQGKIQNTFDPNVENHLAHEQNSAGVVCNLWVKVRWMSPVKSGSQVAGVIVVNTCSIAL